MARHPWKTKFYLQVEGTLGADLGKYINAYRSRIDPRTGNPVSWASISRELWRDTDITVSHETCRSWWTAWSAETPLGDR